MYCRGVRGATTTERDDAEDIVRATRELLEAIAGANGMKPEDIASATFSTTSDLNAAFPAKAARDLGWVDTALFCCREIDVPESLGRCIRVLIHWNTEKSQGEIVHVYLKEAQGLRPDIGNHQ